MTKAICVHIKQSFSDTGGTFWDSSGAIVALDWSKCIALKSDSYIFCWQRQSDASLKAHFPCQALLTTRSTLALRWVSLGIIKRPGCKARSQPLLFSCRILFLEDYYKQETQDHNNWPCPPTRWFQATNKPWRPATMQRAWSWGVFEARDADQCKDLDFVFPAYSIYIMKQIAASRVQLDQQRNWQIHPKQSGWQGTHLV